MPARMTLSAALLFGSLALSCTRNIPPPCVGERCRDWPHIQVRFWRDAQGPQGRPYRGALCVQVALDCPEEGRHVMWVEPQVPRCRTVINNEGNPDWLRVTNGTVSIPWPAQCRGGQIEMYVSAQPNFALCPALNNRLVMVSRQQLSADVSFECRQ